MGDVYERIAKATAALSREGIAKERKNQQQGYRFRGIDDVYNTLSPILSEVGLCILPRVVNREASERATRAGGALFSVVVDMEYDIVSPTDGSKHTVRVVGEAMDSADKATNKAMSAAYKYMAMQTFCIPVRGEDDADETTHDVAPSVIQGRNAAAERREMEQPPAEVHKPSATNEATVKQLAAIHAIWTRLGRDRSEIYQFLSDEFGRKIVSGKDLTAREASAVIDLLKQMEAEMNA